MFLKNNVYSLFSILFFVSCGAQELKPSDPINKNIDKILSVNSKNETLEIAYDLGQISSQDLVIHDMAMAFEPIAKAIKRGAPEAQNVKFVQIEYKINAIDSLGNISKENLAWVTFSKDDLQKANPETLGEYGVFDLAKNVDLTSWGEKSISASCLKGEMQRFTKNVCTIAK